VKAELERAGRSTALISRSGLDLSLFGIRYSHAGLSLEANENSPWSVRQLYYDCQEQKPRLFDQGLAGFVVGTDNPRLGYISLVFLPEGDMLALEAAALDRRRALDILASHYSANAHAFNTRYQNCNQWVAELMAEAWQAQAPQPAEASEEALAEPEARRRRAQAWLAQHGYEPTLFDLGWRPLMWAGQLIPWVHNDDHPPEDLAQLHYRVSMPGSLERFIRARVAGAERVEICHTEHQMVVHRGWEPVAEGCVAGPEDSVEALD
jgi:hypothetical protein